MCFSKGLGVSYSLWYSMMVMCCLVLQGVMESHDNCTWTSGVCSVVYSLGEVRK